MAYFTKDDIDLFKASLNSGRNNRQQTTPTKKKGFLQDNISTGGSIAGALGGAAAGTAILPGVGTILGGLLGGALGGAGGQVAENAISGDDLGTDVASEALWGGATALPFGAVGKLAKAGGTLVKGAGSKTARTAAKGLFNEAAIKTMPKRTLANALQNGSLPESMLGAAESALNRTSRGARLGNRVNETADKVIASQSGMTASQARALGVTPVKTFGNINTRTGLTKLDDMAEVGRNLTGAGETSLLDTITNSAIGEAKGVDVGNLRKVAQDVIDNGASLLSDSQRKQIMRNMTNASTSIYGGAKGSLSSLGSAPAALKQANAFRDTARKLSNGFNPSAQEKQMADIYNKVADNIEKSLYSASGVNESVPLLVKAGSDDLLFKAQAARSAGNEAQAKAYENIAKELQSAKSVKDIRSMKKDFVDIAKIDKATAQAEGARTLTGQQFTTQAGQFAQRPIRSTLGAVADRVVVPVANAAKGLSSRGGNRTLGQSLAQATTRIGGIGALRNADSLMVSPEIDESNNSGETIANNLMDTGYNEPQESNPFGYSSSEIYQALMSAYMAGDKSAVSQLSGMYELASEYEQMQSPGKQKLNATQIQQANNANSALSDLGIVADAIQNDPNVILKGAVPGGSLARGITGTTDYDAAKQNIVDVIARLRSGAAITESEARRYMSLLPSVGDNQQSAMNKLNRLYSLLTGFANPQAATANIEANALSGAL